MPDRIFAVLGPERDVQVLGDQRALLREWQPGTPLEIRKRKSRRSLNQNAWIWGVAYPAIADAIGYEAHEIEQMHYGLWAKFAGVEWDERLDMLVPRGGRSSKSDTKRFSDYMEFLVRFAAQLPEAVALELPDERAA